jgi:hypothetical protein
MCFMDVISYMYTKVEECEMSTLPNTKKDTKAREPCYYIYNMYGNNLTMDGETG